MKQRLPDAYGIFILPPNEETLLQRLRDRKREDEQAIQRRFAEAKREIAEASASKVYDSFVVNEVLDDAIEEAVAGVRARRGREGGNRGGPRQHDGRSVAASDRR